MTGPTKLDELRRHLESRREKTVNAQSPPEKDCCPGGYRQNAIEMLQRRCEALRAEEQELLTLVRILELGSEQYGDGAQDAEAALWRLLTHDGPRGF